MRTQAKSPIRRPRAPLALCFLRVPHVILMAMARRAVTQLREAAYPKELDFEWDSDQE